MRSLTRRSFLAASAASLARPALAAAPQAAEIEFVVVGAGVAGIAAARRLRAANRRFIVVEAAGMVGGRCLTDTHTFEVPWDRGAHWLHLPDTNPLATHAADVGLAMHPAPLGLTLRVGHRNAREGELEKFVAALGRAHRAIRDAAPHGKTDFPCAQALPRDLLDWQPTVEFVLGPFGYGADLGEVSVVDYARSAERDADAFCTQGLGTLVAKLAEGLPIQLSNPVTRIVWGERSRVLVDTDQARFRALAVIVTASIGVLAADKIRFIPALPKRYVDAIHTLRLGSYDHVALELPGNPLAFAPDALVFEKSADDRTAAMVANVAGSALCMVELAGGFGRRLAAQGEQAMIDFALEWLTRLYGADVKHAVRRAAATRWNHNPWTLGASSFATPGGHVSRKVLMEPLRGRLFFAGEAVHETLWGTVGGAWESGERAAETALQQLGFIPRTRTTPRKAVTKRP